MSARLDYVICAPTYNENNGGSLFLHRLAVRLQELGHSVRLAPQPRLSEPGRRARLKALVSPPRFDAAPGAAIPWVRGKKAIGNAIVVYPEVVLGNPLGAQNVVRWLLNKPGLLHSFLPVPGEMYFKAGDFSDDPALTGGAPLLTAWRVNPVYADPGEVRRSGTCYMIRKGADRDIVHDLRGSIRLDGKSHAEIADTFRRTETFYCYDEMTMYAQYAAVCGCLSIVIPKYFASHDDYVATRKIARFGVSYGFDHVAHARATRHLVAGLLEEMARESDATIDRFVELTQRRFAGALAG